MKLVKGFPQPSFHMGVLTLLSQVPDLIVVEFGTEGTMRYFLNAPNDGVPSQSKNVHNHDGRKHRGVGKL